MHLMFWPNKEALIHLPFFFLHYPFIAEKLSLQNLSQTQDKNHHQQITSIYTYMHIYACVYIYIYIYITKHTMIVY